MISFEQIRPAPGIRDSAGPVSIFREQFSYHLTDILCAMHNATCLSVYPLRRDLGMCILHSMTSLKIELRPDENS